MKNKTQIFHTTIDGNYDAENYYIIITEIIDEKIVRSYAVKLPFWVSLDKDMGYKYYKPIFN